MSGRVLFVASTGGHLEQLFRLHAALKAPDQPASWVTFDSPQSRSLLAGESDVVYVPRVPSRGYLQLLRVIVPAFRVLRRSRPELVFSTGAGIALAFLPFAWMFGGRATYIESAARTDGPSLTGKIMSALPWVQLRTQYRAWAGRRWHYRGSVFDGYAVDIIEETPVRRLLVTLGTQEGYPFVSLVARLQEIVPADVEVLWQLGGDYPLDNRPAGAQEMIPRAQLQQWIDSADAIVAHAGVGSALTMLEAGRSPILVPRSASRGEHIDEHQKLIANELAARGLVLSLEPADLTWADVVKSTTMSISTAVPTQPA